MSAEMRMGATKIDPEKMQRILDKQKEAIAKAKLAEEESKLMMDAGQEPVTDGEEPKRVRAITPGTITTEEEPKDVVEEVEELVKPEEEPEVTLTPETDVAVEVPEVEKFICDVIVDKKECGFEAKSKNGLLAHKRSHK